MIRSRRSVGDGFFSVRFWLGAAVVAAFWLVTAWLAAHADRSGADAAAEKAASLDCGECHAAAAAMWERSAHARAATNELFLARMQVSGTRKDCLPCHAPQPVLRTGVTNSVQARRDGVDRGVTCATCHEMVVGVAAASASSTAPCRPRVSAQLTADALCGSCHRAIYADTLGARAGGMQSRCIDCHMARNPDGGVSRDAGHGFAAGAVGPAVELHARRDDGIVVEVVNANPAHAFPGERHNRELMLRVEYEQADGSYAQTQYHTIRAVAPFGGERRSDDIAAGQTYQHTFPDYGSAARIALLYKRVPWILHADATFCTKWSCRLSRPKRKRHERAPGRFDRSGGTARLSVWL